MPHISNSRCLMKFDSRQGTSLHPEWLFGPERGFIQPMEARGMSHDDIPFNGGEQASDDDQAIVITDTTGDLPVWPLWEIRGPATQVELVNLHSGKRLTWIGNLPAGEWLRIDTEPATRNVSYPLNGALAWSGLTLDSQLWSFAPNRATPWAVSVSGRSAESIAQMTWRPNWLSA